MYTSKEEIFILLSIGTWIFFFNFKIIHKKVSFHTVKPTRICLFYLLLICWYLSLINLPINLQPSNSLTRTEPELTIYHTLTQGDHANQYTTDAITFIKNSTLYLYFYIGFSYIVISDYCRNILYKSTVLCMQHRKLQTHFRNKIPDLQQIFPILNKRYYLYYFVWFHLNETHRTQYMLKVVSLELLADPCVHLCFSFPLLYNTFFECIYNIFYLHNIIIDKALRTVFQYLLNTLQVYGI